jgi:hypothetical protein
MQMGCIKKACNVLTVLNFADGKDVIAFHKEGGG